MVRQVNLVCLHTTVLECNNKLLWVRIGVIACAQKTSIEFTFILVIFELFDCYRERVRKLIFRLPGICPHQKYHTLPELF